MGIPTPSTVEYLEDCFYSLAVVVVTGKGVLEERVNSNASLTNTTYILTDTNSRLSKKLETLTAELAKKVGGGGEVNGRGLISIALTARGKLGTNQTIDLIWIRIRKNARFGGSPA